MSTKTRSQFPMELWVHTTSNDDQKNENDQQGTKIADFWYGRDAVT